MSGHPAYGKLRQVSATAAVLLQDNPGPMTLDGTNTWLVRAPGADRTVVVDPGHRVDDPSAQAHLERLLAAAPQVELVLVTHAHPDHADLAGALHEATGAPVRALDPGLCRGAGPLRDGELLDEAGVEVRVLATPGHTADSACFVLDRDPAVLTGDTILGRGTAVVAHPDGNLADYLASLRRLRDLGAMPVLPGHGPELDRVADAAAAYLEHREQRLQQVREALAALGADASPHAIVEHVYADVDPAVWWAAELSVRAQLDYLRG